MWEPTALGALTLPCNGWHKPTTVVGHGVGGLRVHPPGQPMRAGEASLPAPPAPRAMSKRRLARPQHKLLRGWWGVAPS